MHYRLNSPDVAAQIVDGDALVIHFKAGNYFSFNPVGSSVLHLLLERNQSTESIVALLSEAYSLNTEEAERVIASFVESLTTEGLVLAADRSGRSTLDDFALPTTPWAPPSFTKYSDLADLLRLDPIHDVDESGWPVARAE